MTTSSYQIEFFTSCQSYHTDHAYFVDPVTVMFTGTVELWSYRPFKILLLSQTRVKVKRFVVYIDQLSVCLSVWSICELVLCVTVVSTSVSAASCFMLVNYW